jgi:hypothetical protein
MTDRMHFIEHLTQCHCDMVQAMSGEMHKRRDRLIERLILLQNADWCSGITRQLESTLTTIRQSHGGQAGRGYLDFYTVNNRADNLLMGCICIEAWQAAHTWPWSSRSSRIRIRLIKVATAACVQRWISQSIKLEKGALCSPMRSSTSWAPWSRGDV